MPAKFKESENKIVNRKIVGKRHFYLHATPTEEIVKAYENDNTKPKLKNKYKNELVKRLLKLSCYLTPVGPHCL